MLFSNGMKAIILAAGEGIRMRPLTLTKPKPLIVVAGKTLLHRLVETFPETITELILVVGYLSEQIKRHCGNELLGKKITYVTQEKKEGTFPALELCKPYLASDESFCILYADDLVDRKTIEDCIAHKFSIAVQEAEKPERFGVVSLNEDGSVLEIEEKPESPASNLITTSVSVLTPEIFNYQPQQHKNGEYYLSSAINRLAKKHKVMAVQTNFWFPIGTPEDLKRAEKIISSNT